MSMKSSQLLTINQTLKDLIKELEFKLSTLELNEFEVKSISDIIHTARKVVVECYLDDMASVEISYGELGYLIIQWHKYNSEK